MKKSMQKSGTTIAPHTARATSAMADKADKAEKSEAADPWLSDRVAQRLEDGRSMLIDLATDLPFDTVLRGRVSPPHTEVLAQTEPLARVLEEFGPRLPRMAVTATYLRERRNLIGLLEGFEKAGENFLGLIRRTRAVMSAQVEKAMRAAYAVAAEAAPGIPGLDRALQPMGPVLSTPATKPPKK